MSALENKVNAIKVLFADVDNTLLCLKMYDENGKRIVGHADPEDWLRYNINNNAYENCFAPKGMTILVNKILANGGKVYGLTECSNSFEYNSKYNRLREVYDGAFMHHGDLISTDSRHKKVLIMKMLAERDGYKPEEIMFVDDSYTEVMEAFGAGMFSMHTTEALECFRREE